jgi:hypothetical protein
MTELGGLQQGSRLNSIPNLASIAKTNAVGVAQSSVEEIELRTELNKVEELFITHVGEQMVITTFWKNGLDFSFECISHPCLMRQGRIVYDVVNIRWNGYSVAQLHEVTVPAFYSTASIVACLIGFTDHVYGEEGTETRRSSNNDGEYPPRASLFMDHLVHQLIWSNDSTHAEEQPKGWRMSQREVA